MSLNLTFFSPYCLTFSFSFVKSFPNLKRCTPLSHSHVKSKRQSNLSDGEIFCFYFFCIGSNSQLSWIIQFYFKRTKEGGFTSRSWQFSIYINAFKVDEALKLTGIYAGVIFHWISKRLGFFGKKRHLKWQINSELWCEAAEKWQTKTSRNRCCKSSQHIFCNNT